MRVIGSRRESPQPQGRPDAVAAEQAEETGERPQRRSDFAPVDPSDPVQCGVGETQSWPVNRPVLAIVSNGPVLVHAFPGICLAHLSASRLFRRN